MTVDRIAVKKSLAATLALALGLSFPGGVWAQVIGGEASFSGAGVEAAAAASVVSGAAAGTVRISARVLDSVLSAPLHSAPIDLLAARMAVPASAAIPKAAPATPDDHVAGKIKRLYSAGITLPQTAYSHSDAEKIEAFARALPDGSPARASLSQLASAVRISHSGAAAVSADKIGQAMDGAGPASDETVSTPGFLSSLTRFIPSFLRKPVDPRIYELSIDQVRYAPDEGTLPQSTRVIPDVDKQIVGQDGALKAIRFAVEMKPDHYNLFVAGADGSGRKLAVRHILEDVAPKMPTPNDIVKATNFTDVNRSVTLELPPGRGAEFARAVSKFVEAMKTEFPVELSSGKTGRKERALRNKFVAAVERRQAEFDAAVASLQIGKFGIVSSISEDEKGKILSLDLTYYGKPISREEADLKIASRAFTRADWDQAFVELQTICVPISVKFKAMAALNSADQERLQAAITELEREAAAALVGKLSAGLVAVAASGPVTAADQAFAKSAREREAENIAAVTKLAQSKFGPFDVDVAAGVRGNEFVVNAVAKFGEQTLTDKSAARLIKAGKITQDEYDQAKARIAQEAAALQWQGTALLTVINKEGEALKASKPAPAPASAQILSYVESLEEFAAKHYVIFTAAPENGAAGKSLPLEPEDFFHVSVLADNGGRVGAPVVWEENTSPMSLFGGVDNNERSVVDPNGNNVRIKAPGGPSYKPGALEKANGGVVVLDAVDVIASGSFPALMDVAKTGEVKIVDEYNVTHHLPAKAKIVLIGSAPMLAALAAEDPDFAANFQGVAQFQPSIGITAEAVGGFLNFLKHSVASSKGEILDLTRGAIARVLEHAARLADSNRNFTAQFGAVHGLLQQAAYAAQKAGSAEIRREDIDAALQAKTDREDIHYEGMSKLFKDNVFRLDTKGSGVGSINGLAVMGGHGVQFRQTAVAGPVTPGEKPGIYSADKEAGTAGPSFKMGLDNAWSALVHMFGQKKALKVQIRVKDEQSYSGIDGDSATSTTIYNVLSALSGVPIQHRFAVTGSADQFGNVQAIGGVNEKIEGFFELCKYRGLTGDQGVVIPRTNIADVQLKPEVARAIAAGKFHLYSVDTVAQGMEILTGVSFQTIKDKAARRLDQISKAD